MSEEANSYLIPVTEIPGTRSKITQFSAKIIDEFKKSNLQFAEIKLSHPDLKGIKFRSISQSLRYYVKRYKITDVRIVRKKDKLYLERISKET